MALQKPTIGTIAAFDATAAHTISFSVVGGDQVTAKGIGNGISVILLILFLMLHIRL